MSWTLAAALLMAAGSPAPSGVSAVSAPGDPGLVAASQEPAGSGPVWQLNLRVAAPVTTTDPQHIGFSLGIGRSGTYRVALRYQPSESSALGFMRGTLGFRLVQTTSWSVAADVEHAHVWSARRLYRTGSFQFEGHDRRWLTLGVVSVRARDRRWFNLIDGIEAGAGRMVIREMAAGRVSGVALNEDPVLILKTAAPVGMFGVHLSRPLPLGVDGAARVRVIGAGNSRGGVVPFAHVVADWEVMKTIFSSGRHGRGSLGVVGTHASSVRAATYYQNGIGVSLKIVF